MSFDPTKRRFLVQFLGEERTRELEEALGSKEQELLAMGVSYKSLLGGLRGDDEPPARGYADDLRAGKIVR